MNTVNTRVVILTKYFRIEGEIGMLPGVRLTDYINEAHMFVAVTDAKVNNLKDEKILTSGFLNVRRDSIEVILPAEDEHFDSLEKY